MYFLRFLLKKNKMKYFTGGLNFLAYHQCWTPQYGCVRCNRVPSSFGVTMFRVTRFRQTMFGVTRFQSTMFGVTMFRETMFRPTIFWVTIIRVTIVWIEIALSDLVPFVHPYIHPCSFTNMTSEVKLKSVRFFQTVFFRWNVDIFLLPRLCPNT